MKLPQVSKGVQYEVIDNDFMHMSARRSFGTTIRASMVVDGEVCAVQFHTDNYHDPRHADQVALSALRDLARVAGECLVFGK